MGRLDGKVALITGAARGIGAAEARRFVAEGAKVVLGDVLDAEGEIVAKELGDAAVYVHLDVTSPADWQGAVQATTERFAKLDVLVNNAGILRVGLTEQMPLDDFRAVIDVNLAGTFLGMQAAIPAMRAAGGGSIVNTSSTAGMQGYPALSAYAASKWAVRGMTKCVALEVGHDGIRVNSIHPAGIDTPMIHDPQVGDMDLDAVAAAQPIARVGRPEEVAALAVFLASDDSSYSTGDEFLIDGGTLAGQAIPTAEA